MKQQDEKDQQIIDRVLRDGQQTDYALLVDCYGPRLFAFVATMVTCREDAEELAQDCFVKAYAQLAKCTWGLSPCVNLIIWRLKPWLVHILLSAAYIVGR